MAKYYNKDSIDQLLLHVDVVDVVAEKVSLKSSGNLYKGLCPFHQEKSPSFFVNRIKGYYKCFGCGKGGNSVNFLMDYENIDFVTAVEYLASKYHFELKIDAEQTKTENSKDTFYKINQYSLEFFKKQLKDHKNELEFFFNKREITNEIIDEFNIGYAPDDYDLLYKYLKNNFFSDKDMLELGIIKNSNTGSIIDKFRDRIIFPIYDELNNLIGFGGRTLKNKEGIPKYINSSDSLLYNKSKVLYGLNYSKKEIQKEQNAIVVEGYLDMISLYKHGIKNVVAPCGTALTELQLNLLKKFTPKITLCFDGDSAGKEASLKVFEATVKNNLNCKVVTLPDGEDPDTYINSMGKNVFIDFVQNSVKDIFDYYLIQQKLKKKDDIVITNDILTILSEVSNKINVTYALKKVSEKLNIDVKILTESLNELLVRKSYKNNTEIHQQIKIENNKLDKQVKALEKEITIIFIHKPQFLNLSLLNYFENDLFKTILAYLLEVYNENMYITPELFIESLSNILSLEQINFLKNEKYLINENDEKIKNILNDYFKKLEVLIIKKQIDLIKLEIKNLKQDFIEADEEDLMKIMNEKSVLLFDLNSSIVNNKINEKKYI